MKEYLKPFYYFFYVQNFFKTKRIYLIFLLYTICTLIEMLNIGIILPFLNLIFNPETINIEKNFILNFLNIKNIFLNQNYIYVLMLIIVILFIFKSIILVIAAKYQADFFAKMRTKITTHFFNLGNNTNGTPFSSIVS